MSLLQVMHTAKCIEVEPS